MKFTPDYLKPEAIKVRNLTPKQLLILMRDNQVIAKVDEVKVVGDGLLASSNDMGHGLVEAKVV